MVSSKTIKFNSDDKITLKFYGSYITIDIIINQISTTMLRTHNEYNDTINEIKVDLNLTNHQIKKINYWYHNNYKKLYPQKEYITAYGRKVIIK
jgi:hypothetical protein